MTDAPKILAAPLQGYTDAAWRAAHRTLFPGTVAQYFTPFVRIEGGQPRARDLRDTLPDEPFTTPQIIFGNAGELHSLIDTLAGAGHRRIDLNCGCPHPPQLHKGRGAAVVRNPGLMREVGAAIESYPEISFSLKMRPGVESSDEWRGVAAEIARMRLEHVVVHARTARMLYRGSVDVATFEAVAAALPMPMYFNGDILAPAELPRGAAGVMIGRGLLGRPSLAAEWAEGCEWPLARRVECLLQMHRLVYDARAARLCGDAQLLSAMQPFWHFSESEIGHRNAKALRKARTLEAYHRAVESITKNLDFEQ